MGTKINKILKEWPAGTVATAPWFNKYDIGHQLRQSYEKSHWIKHLGRGAFIRDGDDISWKGALYAIQKQLYLPIHVAAKTALELQGSTHFLPATTENSIYLFGAVQTKLPSWFKQHDWQIKLHYRATSLFAGKGDLGLFEKAFNNFSLQISSKERAILEWISLISTDAHMEEILPTFEGLRTLRPKLLQGLLEHCNSIKAKRLFLYFAELTNQPWLKSIHLSPIKLGTGKRMIGKGGVFHSKYNLSLPKFSEL